MNKCKNKKKPWLDRKGCERPVEELKRISLSWNKKTWESYLQWKESPQNEVILQNPLSVEDLSVGDFTGMLFGFSEQSDYPVLGRIVVQQTINKLTQRQKKIIKMRFWEGKNICEISRELGVSRRSIRVSMDQGLSKMKKIIESGEIIDKIQSISPLFADMREKPELLPSILRGNTTKV